MRARSRGTPRAAPPRSSSPAAAGPARDEPAGRKGHRAAHRRGRPRAARAPRCRTAPGPQDRARAPVRGVRRGRPAVRSAGSCGFCVPAGQWRGGIAARSLPTRPRRASCPPGGPRRDVHPRHASASLVAHRLVFCGAPSRLVRSQFRALLRHRVRRTARAIRGEHVMTTIQESPRPTVPIGQAVGQAEASLTRLLAGVLAESGTSHQTYLALQRLTNLGGRATRDAYERDLIDWLELDGPGARRLASELVSAGLVAVEPNG